MLPVTAYGSAVRSRSVVGFADSTKKAYEEASTIAAEAIRDVRTVTALVRQDYFYEKYCGKLHQSSDIISADMYRSGTRRASCQRTSQSIARFPRFCNPESQRSDLNSNCFRSRCPFHSEGLDHVRGTVYCDDCDYDHFTAGGQFIHLHISYRQGSDCSCKRK